MEKRLGNLENTINQLEDTQSPQLYQEALVEYQDCHKVFQSMKIKSLDKYVEITDFDQSLEKCMASTTELETILTLKDNLLEYINIQLKILENSSPIINY